MLKITPSTPTDHKHFQQKKLDMRLTKKSISLLYTNEKWTEEEISKTTHVKIQIDTLKGNVKV